MGRKNQRLTVYGNELKVLIVSTSLLYMQITNIIGFGTVVYMLIPIMYNLLKDKKLAYIRNNATQYQLCKTGELQFCN